MSWQIYYEAYANLKEIYILIKQQNYNHKLQWQIDIEIIAINVAWNKINDGSFNYLEK